MGQYHELINLDKKEKVSPHGLGLGLKQLEHLGAFDGTLADAMYILCMTSPDSGGGDLPMTAMSGRWAGDRVVIYGDYTSSIPGYPEGDDLDLDTFTDITPDIREAFTTIWGMKFAPSSWAKDGDMSGWLERISPKNEFIESANNF